MTPELSLRRSGLEPAPALRTCRCAAPTLPDLRSATWGACGGEGWGSPPRNASPRRFRSSGSLTAQRAIYKGFDNLTG